MDRHRSCPAGRLQSQNLVPFKEIQDGSRNRLLVYGGGTGSSAWAIPSGRSFRQLPTRPCSLLGERGNVMWFTPSPAHGSGAGRLSHGQIWLHANAQRFTSWNTASLAPGRSIRLCPLWPRPLSSALVTISTRLGPSGASAASRTFALRAHEDDLGGGYGSGGDNGGGAGRGSSRQGRAVEEAGVGAWLDLDGVIRADRGRQGILHGVEVECIGGIGFRNDCQRGRWLRAGPPDLIAEQFREPEIAVRAGRDRERIAVGGWDGEFGDGADWRDAPDLVAELFREPKITVWAGCDAHRIAPGRWHGEFGDGAGWRDAPNLVAELFREPEVAVRAGCDPKRIASGGWDGELGDGAGWRNAPDLVALLFREPEIAVRAGRDPDRNAAGRRDGELGDGAGGRDASDLVARLFREPEIAVWAGCDPLRSAVGRWDCELGDGAGGRDAPDLVARLFREPEIAVRAGCDPMRTAVGRWDGELGDRAGGRDAPDLVGVVFREPEIAVRAGCDPNRTTVGRRDGELRDGDGRQAAILQAFQANTQSPMVCATAPTRASLEAKTPNETSKRIHVNPLSQGNQAVASWPARR